MESVAVAECFLQYKYVNPMSVCKDFCDRSVICDCLVQGLCNYGEGSMNNFKW